MSSRNKPLQAQQPAPLFANDQLGFWEGTVIANRSEGISSLLPPTTLQQSDTAIKGRLLAAQIGWTPTLVRWEGASFKCSISDAQFFLSVEEGGDTQQGKITLLLNKLELQVGKWPTYQQMVEVLAGGKWHSFVIADVSGQHDDNDPGLTLYLEKDQDDIGE